MRRVLSTGLLGLAFMAVALTPAHAVPILQLFIEGATYDVATETWITTASAFTLWVIGDVDPPGPQFAAILNVHLTAAFPTAESGTITLTPTTTGLLTDPSTPSAPSQTIFGGNDGVRPTMNDGSLLPAHGVYVAGTSFDQWDIGDLSLADSPVGDFINAFPSTFPDRGQINAYSVSVTGYSLVHFDAFNHVASSTHSKFAPFSHDAEAAVPEPTSLIILGLGLAGGAALRARRHRPKV